MKKYNIVTIGGGTGSFTLLSGLKKYPVNISAIVSMADDGGSTGRLRDELGVLPPGDVRQCLVALSDSTQTLRDLMNYRFEKGDLAGHNFGNLFLSALEKTQGGFLRGVEEVSQILNVKGTVIPVSSQDMVLNIELKNKKVIVGEKQLDHNQDVRNIGIKRVYLKPKVQASESAVAVIKKADMIVIGPGDHYGSIVPNLLVEGIPQAIAKSKAKVVYNCNLTNKRGQTDGFDLDRYAEEINGYIGKERIDFVLSNSNGLSKYLVEKYEKKEGKDSIVKFNADKKEKRRYRVVVASVVKMIGAPKRKNDALAETRSFIRHDSGKLAKVLMMILEMDEYNNLIKEII
ncbi:MAG: YvcK family protein [Candidatus Moranbacteria bacterium]|jgi:uncharacterized cofD-like protein|nr:YvcK family protein [Candidatus Moranbacteria bacterium]